MWNIYKHTKGKLYLRLCTALHSESCEPLIVYRALYDNEMAPVWARPEAMFDDEVAPGQSRFIQVARVRILMPEDKVIDFNLGDRDILVDRFTAPYKDNSNYQTRYLIETSNGDPVGNISAIRFARGLVGITALSVSPNYRRQGYGSMLTRAVMELIRGEDSATRFILHSPLESSMHERLGFYRAPDACQFHLPTLTMITGDKQLTEYEISFLSKYF